MKIAWGRHPTDQPTWIKLWEGKDKIGERVRKQRGWQIIYRKVGDKPEREKGGSYGNVLD